MGDARRLRVQPALCQEMVEDCLGDVAMRLRQYTTPIPRSLAPYLVRALRLHRLARLRGERRRPDRDRGDGGSRHDAPDVLGGSVSEAALRDSAGPGHERTPASPAPALERLASMVEEGLSAEEELLLSWVSKWVPQSTIAEWLGITHGAARNRVMRLRARLKEAALRQVISFSHKERAELMDFFRRTFPVNRYEELSRAVDEATRGTRKRTGTDGEDDET